MKDDYARAWLRSLFEPGVDVRPAAGYKPPLPVKVVSEIGRLLFTDVEVIEMAEVLAGAEDLHDETDNATFAEIRAKILARLPAVRELYERALMLKSKGWGSGVIAADIRRLRLKLTHTEPRATDTAKYEKAVNAVYLAAKDRAFALGGNAAELTVRLLRDALAAAEAEAPQMRPAHKCRLLPRAH
jgi:hypothetical protein